MNTLALGVCPAETLLPNEQKDKPCTLARKHWQQQKKRMFSWQADGFFPPLEALQVSNCGFNGRWRELLFDLVIFL